MNLRFWSYSADGTPSGDSHPKGEMASFVWAHGTAEEFVGTDLLHTDNFEAIRRLETGVFPVLVLNPEHTVVKNATLYFVRKFGDRYSSGLVVLDDDEAGEEALRTYNKVREHGGSMGFIVK